MSCSDREKTGSEVSIHDLRELCGLRAVQYTAHILSRLEERGIFASDVRHCIMTGQIIEQYPEDYPYPSCLVSGEDADGQALHTVVGIGGGHIWLITAYRPNPARWKDGYSKRKES